MSLRLHSATFCIHKLLQLKVSYTVQQCGSFVGKVKRRERDPSDCASKDCCYLFGGDGFHSLEITESPKQTSGKDSGVALSKREDQRVTFSIRYLFIEISQSSQTDFTMLIDSSKYRKKTRGVVSISV